MDTRANPTENALQLQLTVRLHHYAEVPAKTLKTATDKASRVYRQAGIRIVWVNCSATLTADQDNPVCGQTLDPAHVVVNILPESMAKEMKLRRSIFGLAAVPQKGGFAQIASIFYDRLGNFVQSAGNRPAAILGAMLAHEIGHLLLGKGSHSTQGLMVCPWRQEQIRAAERGGLMLSREESRRVISAMCERTWASRNYSKQ